MFAEVDISRRETVKDCWIQIVFKRVFMSLCGSNKPSQLDRCGRCALTLSSFDQNLLRQSAITITPPIMSTEIDRVQLISLIKLEKSVSL